MENETCTVCGATNETVTSDYNAHIDADWDTICEDCYDWCHDVVVEHYRPTRRA